VSRAEQAIGLAKVFFRVGYHVAVAAITVADCVEEDVRVHLLREPRANNSTQGQVMAEAEELKRSRNDYAPVNLSEIS
tara:strand:- start:603 stop:836 length:234 start_codon:yes stop_codon:yes gene_type:complete